MTEEIQRLVKRLEDEKTSLSARIKKRIYQKIGKLKKQLPALSATNEEASFDNPILSKRKSVDDQHPKKDVSKKRKKKKVDTTHIGNKDDVEDEENEEEEEEEEEEDDDDDDDGAEKTQVHQHDGIVDGKVSSLTEKSAADSASKRIAFTRKEQKAIIHLLNKELKEFAIKKQLNRAKKLFRQHLKKGLTPDVHTFSNLLNVYIRCQDIAGAEDLFNSIPSPNIVTYTTLLRGYCESGLMLSAKGLIFNQMIPSDQWNIRSLNTFLRGCLRTGFVQTAVQAFQFYQSKCRTIRSVCEDVGEEEQERNEKWEPEEDDQLQQSACFESVVSLLTRAGRVHQALEILKEYLDFVSSQSPSSHRTNLLLTNAALTSVIAKFFTVFGYFSEAKKYLLLTEEILSKKDLHSSDRSSQIPTQGNEQHQKSVQLFQKFQKKEIQSLLEQCEEYISRIQSSTTDFRNSRDTQTIQINLSIELYYYLLRQVIYIGFHPNNCDEELDGTTEAKSFHDYLVNALVSKFGYGMLHSERFSEIQPAGSRSPHIESSSSYSYSSVELKERIQRIFHSKPAAVVTASQLESTQVDSIDEEFNQTLSYSIDLKQLFSHSKTDSAIKGASDTASKEAKSVSEKNKQTISFESSLEDYYRFLDSSPSEQERPTTTIKHKGNAKKINGEHIPTCLEIGSGNGDWIVAQSAASRRLVEVDDTDNLVEASGDSEGGCTKTDQPQKITWNSMQKEKEAQKLKQRKRKKKVWTVRANWIALELRYDRCSNILTNHYLELALLSSQYQQQQQQTSSSQNDASNIAWQQLPPNNLAILSGDARPILSRYLPSSSIYQIFINYPQPPDRITAGMHDKDQGKHLYTIDVLSQMIAILEDDGGKLTILSDNLLYIQLIANNLLHIAEQTTTLALKQRGRSGTET